MPRLIHLNGPPGIGKSTLAQWYVDNHPGVLNLDIDQVRCLIGVARALRRDRRTGTTDRPRDGQHPSTRWPRRSHAAVPWAAG
ncbi:MAG: hypothetical protein WKF73_06810 [Nocardioidaceae bacterium]